MKHRQSEGVQLKQFERNLENTIEREKKERRIINEYQRADIGNVNGSLVPIDRELSQLQNTSKDYQKRLEEVQNKTKQIKSRIKKAETSNRTPQKTPSKKYNAEEFISRIEDSMAVKQQRYEKLVDERDV